MKGGQYGMTRSRLQVLELRSLGAGAILDQLQTEERSQQLVQSELQLEWHERFNDFSWGKILFTKELIYLSDWREDIKNSKVWSSLDILKMGETSILSGGNI